MGHDNISCRRDIPLTNIPCFFFLFVKTRRVFSIRLPLPSKRNTNRLDALKKMNVKILMGNDVTLLGNLLPEFRNISLPPQSSDIIDSETNYL